MYIWEQPGWPRFRGNDADLIAPLAAARLNQGRWLGRMQSLGLDLQRGSKNTSYALA